MSKTNIVYFVKAANLILQTTMGMLSEIFLLEEKFNALLPNKHEHLPASNELIQAGSNWSLAVWQVANSIGKMQFTEQQIEQALLFSERAIFICGSQRTGTTLVRNLLDAHPQLSVLPSEGTYINYQEKQMLQLTINEQAAFLCREWLWRLANPVNMPPYWLLGRSSDEQSPYIAFAMAFIAWWHIAEEKLSSKNSLWPFVVLQLAFATAQGKIDSLKNMYWAEKTPDNEMNMERLWHEFPHAKFIQAIRNPIDVTRSHKPAQNISSIELKTFIRFLRKSFIIANHQLNKKESKHLLVRYEELCEQPEAVAKQMANFIGIPFMPILLMPTIAGKPAEANSSFKQDKAAGKVIAQKQHAQKDMLTKKDLQLLSAYLFRPAAKFGYQLQPIGILQQQYIKAIVFAQRAMGKIRRALSTKHRNA